jgi:sarcosine oxidase subunit alpha
MHVLRAEKGFIIVGQDTDGTCTPMDVDMDWIVSKKKKDFLGKRSFTRSDTAREGRKQLVGLLAQDPNFVLPEGAHIVDEAKAKPPMKALGHVTSSYMSPNVLGPDDTQGIHNTHNRGRSIAMALVSDGFKRKGETLHVSMMDGKVMPVTVVGSVFFDVEGERTRG